MIAFWQNAQHVAVETYIAIVMNALTGQGVA